MSKVLVTGATGLIGSRLVNTLAERGDTVTALSRNKDKLDRLFSGKVNVQTVVADACEPFVLDGIKLIFHAAGPISGEFISRSPVDVIRPNVFALQSLFERIISSREKTGVNSRVIVFSSATVYGNAKDTDITVTESDTSNSDTLDAVNAAYSESKRMAEVLTRAYVRQHGIDSVIVRPSWVYGETLFAPNTALYSFINNLLIGQDITLNKSGTARRDNIYVGDAVNGLLTVSEKGQAGESFNISSGGNEGNFAAIDEIAELLTIIINHERGMNLRVYYKEPNNGKRAGGIILDNSKFRELNLCVGNNLTPLSDGLRKTILSMEKLSL